MSRDIRARHRCKYATADTIILLLSMCTRYCIKRQRVVIIIIIIIIYYAYIININNINSCARRVSSPNVFFFWFHKFYDIILPPSLRGQEYCRIILLFYYITFYLLPIIRRHDPINVYECRVLSTYIVLT